MLHSLNNFFSKIFLISIKRNEQRLELFKKNNPDLDIEIIQCIDGTELYPAIEHINGLPQIFFTDNNLSYNKCSRFNKGQLGCAMSNLIAQKEIIKQQLQCVLILEDEALLIAERLPDFNTGIKELPSDWDLFYLGFNPISKWYENPLTRQILRFKYLLKPIHIAGMNSADTKKQFLPASYSKNINNPGIYTGTHAYALSYKGAKKIVNIDTPLQYGFDMTLIYANYNKLIKSYSLNQALFIPNSNFETSLIN